MHINYYWGILGYIPRFAQVCLRMVITRITNCKTDPLNSGCLVVVIVAVLVVVLR